VRRLAAALLGSAIFFARRAHADESSELDRPLTLPQLTHRFTEITLESTLALVSFAAVDRAQSSSTVRVDRLSAEIPLGSRVWFAGAGYGFATGHLADGSPHVVSGNPEIWGRGVWASAYGLSFGGGLATVIPVGGYDERVGDSVAEAAVTVRGWERASFDPYALTFRPFLDVRDVTGIFTLQYRQALEVALDARDVLASSRFAAVGTLYVGIRASSFVTFGAELIEHYRLDPNLDDRDRAYFSVGGVLRITTRYYQPSLGLMTNIGSPLNALARVGAPLDSTPESFIGLRLGLTFVVNSAKKKETP